MKGSISKINSTLRIMCYDWEHSGKFAAETDANSIT